jgi:MFS family permease
VPLLDPELVGPDLGWRLAFGSGAVLGLVIIFLRRYLPESPRWLMIHGREGEARKVMDGIEARVMAGGHPVLPPFTPTLLLGDPHRLTLASVARTLLKHYPSRTVLGLVLMASQAFVYNAIFFTYALVLTTFYGVRAENVGYYIFPFAVGNFLGPLLLGRWFDTIGRRVMLAATYGLSGIGLLATGYAFAEGWLDARTQTLCWSAIFFFASAAASSAYLTVSEIFPLEMRAIAISLFYALGTGVGGFVGPALFGALIEAGERSDLFAAYASAAAAMIAAAVVAALIGVDAERKPLETVARPLSAHDGDAP